MNIQDVDYLINCGGILLVVMTVIQITPIKINPWSWIARKIGRAINGEMVDELKEQIDILKADIQDLRAECDEREATLCRTHILNFGDEILHDVRHSKERFEQILRDITTYQNYCESHPGYLNNVADATMDKIIQTYKDCLDNHDFL